MIESLLRDAEQVYSQITGAQVQHRSLEALTGTKISTYVKTRPTSSSTHSNQGSEPERDQLEADSTADSAEDGLSEWISSPLAVLANAATGRERKAEATLEEQGYGVFTPYGKDNVVTTEEYFAAGELRGVLGWWRRGGSSRTIPPAGLYEIRLDIAPELDPVTIGLLNLNDLSVLVDL